ncbi:hypothetical protein Acr_00g0057480 [Actinidia rufa]|uniref:Uncharacterized protein n=1 Tax=Actinidia rufa TaxID=165716 RepID=A0A7J0DN43_9ERIC|nr:hypothetical protein Acr_00g0057480 [Actinidia rufa]
MASESTNDRTNSQFTRQQKTLMLRILGEGGKLLADARRVDKGHSNQRSGRLLVDDGEDSQAAAIRRLEASWQICNKLWWPTTLIPPVTKVTEGPFKVRSTQRTDVPRGCSKGKQVAPDNTKAESRSDNRSVVSGKRRVPPGRVPSVVDHCDTLNAKRSRDEGDLRAKLCARTSIIFHFFPATKTIIVKSNLKIG